MKNNRIPRKFNKIVAKMNIKTSADEIGDIVYITKVEGKYISYNTRTEKQGCIFVDMIRNKELVNILEII